MIRFKQIIPVILLTFIAVSCTTMPPEIDEKYLTEKTEIQSKTIADYEAKIIDKNKEKQLVEKKTNELTALTIRTEDEIKLIKKENTVLKDQVYLYEKNKDAVNLEPKKKQLANNETLLSEKSSLLRNQMAEKKFSEAELDLKNAELALLIAEMRYEKSNIATQYRDKNEPREPKEKDNYFISLWNKITRKDPNDRYGYNQYGKYMDKMKEEKVKAEEAYREAEKKFLDLKKSTEGKK